VSQRERLLTGINREERDLLARILDLADLARHSRQPQFTDFYDPYHTGLIISALERLPGLLYGLEGGYPEAERQMVIICPDHINPADLSGGAGFLSVEGNFRRNSPSHRDFLGSLLGLGLKRGKVGDILVNDRGAQIVVAAGVVNYIKGNLLKVARWMVELKEISREELAPSERKSKEISATVASLRLDAVAAAGYGISRAKMSAAIASEKVQLNWQSCRDTSRAVREGDVISFKGRGRLEISEVKGISRGGRIFITLCRLLNC
jgi:RNA-binding protein YlmH